MKLQIQQLQKIKRGSTDKAGLGIWLKIFKFNLYP